MTVATNHTLLGVYTGAPDNANAGNDAATTQQYNGFVSTMGQTPSMMVTYVDGTIPESEWVPDAHWAADSWKADAWTQALIPVIGIPMAAKGEDADQSFKNIANGSEDSIFNGIFQAWADAGHTQQYIRPGFEMNGNWMPWSVTADNTGDYLAAFQRIADLAHAFTGASIQVVWNPNVGGALPIGSLYPGNTAVDIVGLDTYGAPINNDASPNDTSGNVTLTDTLALAKANGKPFALPETGAANASFPTALASVVAQSGVPVAFVSMWDINDTNGNLSWSNPGENQATAAAWKNGFQTIADASNALSGSTPPPANTPTPLPPPVNTPMPPPPVAGPPSANDTVVMPGSTAAITDAAGNQWTITGSGQVATNGTVDAVTANVTELAYVDGKIWQENSDHMWWGEAQPNSAWANTPGTANSPLPAAPSTTPPNSSPNDTVVMAGSAAAINDASGNQWTITGGGQVAANGTVDAATANVTELAYVNGTIWQETSDKMWWGETAPNSAWADTPGTANSPLPASITIALTEQSVTVIDSQISIAATAGDHMVLISGSGDTLKLSGGHETITDTAGNNTYVVPAAGNGYDAFTSDILNANDTLDLTTALAATDWNGAASTLSSYLSVADSASGEVLSIAPTSGGAGVAIASINGATADLTALLAHAVT